MSEQHQTIWEILGIGPTGDKKIIRHAYARKCRECHPEDHPEEFRLLHQAYEQALSRADTNSRLPSPMDETGNGADTAPLTGNGAGADASPQTDSGAGADASPQADSGAGADAETAESAGRKEPEFLTSEQWDELLEDASKGEAMSKEEAVSESALSSERWDELLSRGMEEAAVFPPSPSLLSWQQTDRTRFSSAALTESEKLLEQMKHLEVFCRDNPPQEDSAWQNFMENWDLLADSHLFRQTGESHCYFQILFGWLNEERGRLHIPTIIGLLRIYKIKERIIGHPWKSRRFDRKIPELRQLAYEYMFYQSIWDRELFLEKFDKYGERKAKKTAEKPEKIQQEEVTASGKTSEGGLLRWMSEHRLLWKLFCVVLILLFRYFSRMGG